MRPRHPTTPLAASPWEEDDGQLAAWLHPGKGTMTAERIRPENVKTAEDLANGLKRLSEGMSTQRLTNSARKLKEDILRGEARPAILGRMAPANLAKQTLSDLFSKGRTSEETLRTYLAVCSLADREREEWLAAWLRTTDKSESIRVTVESNNIETAPAYAESIDSWLVRQREMMLARVGAGGSPAAEIREIVDSAGGLIAYGMNLVQQLQPDLQRKPDPVEFGKICAEAAEISLGRLMQLPRFLAKNHPIAGTASYQDEVEKYVTDSRPALHLRARILLACWPGCSLRLRVSNPTDTDAVGIVMRLSFRSGVEVVDPALLKAPLFGLPPRPVRRDPTSSPTPTLRDLYDEDFGLVRKFKGVFVGENGGSEYTIVEAESPVVEIRGVDVPSKGSTLLPPIPLLTNSAEGEKLPFRWNVTGGVGSRSSAEASVPIAASTFPLDGLFPDQGAGKFSE